MNKEKLRYWTIAKQFKIFKVFQVVYKAQHWNDIENLYKYKKKLARKWQEIWK